MKTKTLTFLNKYGLKVGGIFMVLVSLLVIRNGVIKKKITEENRIVSAKVLETPLNCDNLGRRGGYYKLEFNGKVFVKNGNRLICEQVFGKESVDVLTNLKKDKIVFLNEYENSNDILYGTLLVLIGLVITFIIIPPENRTVS
ncbi:hypothetical protein [Flagellimonas okinawensis]|uniref:DUF3592 domain-containing protein n=1 Tax=Flagellimonas okinawensis TaxID=3031324 RepID=A0ABT5XQX3_9FLAO|nr:hypothetical protein [[Muricauda] okinawensis]MDF0708279.1 hypothetical protein [[Muricauda] okinawensis]